MGAKKNIRSISSTSTMNSYDDIVRATTGAIKVNLPTAVGLQNKEYLVRNDAGVGSVIVDPNSTETIGGQLIFVLSPGQYVKFVSNNSNWLVTETNRTSIPRASSGHWIVGRVSNTTTNISGGSINVFGGSLNNNDNTTGYLKFTSSGTTGSFAGLEISSFNHFRINHNPVLYAVLKTDSSIANMRSFVGLATTSMTNADNQGGSSCLLRYSTVAGDTGWTPINDNGTQSVGTTIGTVATDTQYRILIVVDYDNGAVYYSVNESSWQVLTSNIPASGTDMGFFIESVTNENVSKILNFSRFELLSN